MPWSGEFVNVISSGIPFTVNYDIPGPPVSVIGKTKITWNIAAEPGVPDSEVKLRVEDDAGNKVEFTPSKILSEGAPTPIDFDFSSFTQVTGSFFPGEISKLEWELDTGSASGGELFIFDKMEAS